MFKLKEIYDWGKLLGSNQYNIHKRCGHKGDFLSPINFPKILLAQPHIPDAMLLISFSLFMPLVSNIINILGEKANKKRRISIRKGCQFTLVSYHIFSFHSLNFLC